jgi:hypothetical protein
LRRRLLGPPTALVFRIRRLRVSLFAKLHADALKGLVSTPAARGDPGQLAADLVAWRCLWLVREVVLRLGVRVPA